MKAFIGSIFLFMFSYFNLVKCQVTELGTMPGEVNSFWTTQGIWFAERMYYNDLQMSIYKSDCSHYKDIEFTFVPSEIAYISDKLFNSDNKIEFFLRYDVGENLEKACICNEDGEILYDFGDHSFVLHELCKQDNQKFILVIKTFDVSATESKVYELPGDYLQVNEIHKPGFGLPYPNPSDDIIEIPLRNINDSDLTFKVYDASGMLIHQEILDTLAKEVQIKTGAFMPGVYIYSGGGVRGKFVVK